MSFNFPPPSPAEASADPLAPPMPVCDSRRPRLLLCAARHGLSLYRRDRDLPRLMARASGQRPLDLLTEAEARAETDRRSGAATYSFARHIDILIALLTEQHLCARL